VWVKAYIHTGVYLSVGGGVDTYRGISECRFVAPRQRISTMSMMEIGKSYIMSIMPIMSIMAAINKSPLWS
jgi:hypothetical protein